MCAEWIRANISGYVAVDAAAVDAVAVAAVEKFKEMLTEVAKAILADSGDKNFSLDIQNIILAFAGRVLLRKADVRFERGHRYGLIGQNGTGKTTLLNRLSAKDINGFPQELKTWYIRHEVLCEDGITVKTFLKQNAPEEKQTDAAILQVRDGTRLGHGAPHHTHSARTAQPRVSHPAPPSSFPSLQVLEEVGFPDDLKDTYVNSLSGGWKMRMSIAISILHEPELLLLDEPTNHLDRDAIEWLEKHLLSLEGAIGRVSDIGRRA